MDVNARVWAIPAKGGGSRAVCDRMNSWAQEEGQPGLGYIFFRDGEGAGPIAKNIGAERTAAIKAQLELADGDAVFFVAGLPNEFADFAGRARVKIGDELKLTDKDQFAFCWIVDYPMYEWNEDERRVDFSHNPFSRPQGGLAALETKDPLDILAYQYDIVCNGVELSSGAIRNHRPDIMIKAFALAGYGREVLEERFGGMFRALHYGAPPHGGIAPGIDRIVMLIADQPNLREVTAFPLNQQAQELVLGAPSPVDEKQLKELNLQLSLTAREQLRAEREQGTSVDHLVSPHAG
jgi:aspartyl-tRNA synthetase